MEIKIKEIINWVYSDYKDRIVQIHTIKDSTVEDCFKRVYVLRRSGRYDNVRRYDFDDHSLEERYQKWVEQNETIEMYYGSGTVD